MRRHELKIWPQYFNRVNDGSKTFEVRKNDRGFCPGDEVILREWSPDPLHTSGGRYTGRELAFRVGYLMPLENELLVVFSLLPRKEPTP